MKTLQDPSKYNFFFGSAVTIVRVYKSRDSFVFALRLTFIGKFEQLNCERHEP